ncbi:TonB-linked outer membrane protein, SusC/RagA family [Mucilaginibacter pineti]|uniref:TonB-linked outer membrane protein, SusC/RagA family n=1 Tax=Mucilaginibacter pineti TaxID=1391627 RepID=A0A1G6ZJK6_9SPHI|nr:TonB-dependent receptor [Mucilaginibacter pineti]SDE02593.1 TonB-linked outer membrane protein, SusC/RagA family [Mucilaginibacter pineti]
MNFNVKTSPLLWHRFSGISLQIKATAFVLFALPISLIAKPSHSSNILYNKYISNKNANRLLPVIDTPTVAAAKPVSGVITDAKGEILPGVTIKVKGSTTQGAIADANGKFTINVDDKAILVFSYLGFDSQEIPVSGKSTVNVSMAESSNSLKEVVVVGYGTQKREELTSAVTNVKAKDFNQGGARNPLDLVQGKVAGLTITRNGGNDPNSGPSIQLRGVTSIVGNNGPLIVIDGIPGGNLDLLQQDDIESMSVLKDGSAAAIYGTRANGGVILVTTKKGKKGATSVDYSTYFSRDFLLKKPDFLDAAGYRSLIASGKIAKQYDLGSSNDFYDQLLDKSNLSQYHNIAFSGGSENSTFRASVFYNDLNGIALQNGRVNYGTRISFTQKAIQGKLNTQINLATNTNKANLLGGGTSFESALVENPTTPLYNPDGTYYEDPTYANQLARLNQEKSTRDQQTTSTDVKTTLDIIPGLKASIFGSIQRNSYVDNQYWDSNSRDSQRGSLNGAAIDSTGYASKGSYLEKNYAVEPTLEYNTVIGKKHNINAIAGYSYQYNVTESFSGQNAGFPNDGFGENNLTAGTFLLDGKSSLNSFKEDNRLIAFFGRVNYNYEDKYLAQFVFRREGSSKFGANHKWGSFPAVSLGWNITREDFMKSVTFLSNLKLRAGYGITGNQGFPNYQSLVTLNTGNPYITNIDAAGGETWRQTYGPDHNRNLDLRWEKKKELNIGLDFGLFNNAISGTLDVYNRKTTDLLENYDTQLPPFIQSTIFTNVGSIQNKGIELALTGQIVNKKDFSYSATITASTQSNKLISFSNDLYNIPYREYAGINGNGALGNAIRTYPGGKLGEFFGHKFAGFTPDGDWLFYKADGVTKVGVDEITNTDKVDLGKNGIPKYYASLTNSFRYKNLDLTIFLRGKFGYSILNTTELSYGNQVALPNNVLKSATTTHKDLNGSYQYSDYYLENGSFVKVDNITLGYNFNFKTKYIRNLRVYASGKNLATITSYKGVDPEIEDTGLAPGVENHGTYPRTRTITLGLNVGF